MSSSETEEDGSEKTISERRASSSSSSSADQNEELSDVEKSGAESSKQSSHGGDDASQGHQSGSHSSCGSPSSSPHNAGSEAEDGRSSSSSSSSESSSSEMEDALPDPEPIDYIFETNEQHKSRHEYPSKVRNCSRCFYLHNMRKWQEVFTFEDPRTQRPISWLYDTPNPDRDFWHIGCTICNRAGKTGPFAKCQAEPKRSNIERHGKCDGHKAAVAQHVAQVRNEENPDVEDGKDLAFSSSPLAVGYSHIMFQRVLIKTGSSFLSFKDWLKTAQLSGADVPTGAFGNKVSAQLTEVMAMQELAVTQKLFEAASVAAVIQDARDDKVPVLLKLVLWNWPRGLPRHEGKLPAGVTAFGPKGGAPWVGVRVATVGTAAEKSEGLSIAVAKASLDEAKADINKRKVRFVVTDGAFDALSYADAAVAELPNCRFHSEDESHGAMTILKHAMKGDEEIAATDALFVSGKNPYSLAKFMGTSSHFARLFQAEQARRPKKPLILTCFNVFFRLLLCSEPP